MIITIWNLINKNCIIFLLIRRFSTYPKYLHLLSNFDQNIVHVEYWLYTLQLYVHFLSLIACSHDLWISIRIFFFFGKAVCRNNVEAFITLTVHSGFIAAILSPPFSPCPFSVYGFRRAAGKLSFRDVEVTWSQHKSRRPTVRKSTLRYGKLAFWVI